MEAVWSSETLVNVYQTTRRNIPEDSHLQATRESEPFCVGNSFKEELLDSFSIREYGGEFIFHESREQSGVWECVLSVTDA
jgi:hypothetical protein